MNREKHSWLYDVLFLLVFVLAGYLRLTGINWGEGAGQHPDENAFSSWLSALQAHKCLDPNIPVEACPPDQRRWLSLGDYFNSQTSTLNPYNRGFGSFVYGDLHIVSVRIAVELLNPDDPKVLGRQASAIADLFAIFFLYLVVSRLYNQRVALLASLFSALAVTQIQQSHFFTSDLYVNTFEMLAIYFAVAILDAKYSRRKEKETESLSEPVVETSEPSEAPENVSPETSQASPGVTTHLRGNDYRSLILGTIREPLFLLSIGFGVAYGLAMASKLNIYPLAILLPAAFILRYFIKKKEAATQDETLAVENGSQIGSNHHYWMLVAACLFAGGLAAVLTFRIFQPYAFDGLRLDPRWVADIQQQRAQATGEADMPWNLQWARRSHLYSFTNLTVWGLGLPLGILAWAGFLFMAWRIYKGEWRHALLWGWTALYFGWQSLQFNPTMRYQLPIYPLLAMMAAWFVFEVPSLTSSRLVKYGVRLAGALVVVLTAMWAFAFHTIYLRDEPRVAASRWIFQNVPGPINLEITQSDGQLYNQPLPFPTDGFIQAGQPYDTSFVAQSTGTLSSITLPHALNQLASSSTLKLTLNSSTSPAPDQPLATASLRRDFSSMKDPRGNSYTLTLDQPVSVTQGQQFNLRFEVDLGSLELSGATVANETSFDYTLPLRVGVYDPFGGIYRGDLNLEVYWDDNADKLNRFVDILNQTDYILIPTNHQYAQITRVPERYPLMTLYYRDLIGCPAEKNIIECYRNAQPGDYQGKLGFDLVAVFETYPKLGSLVINDQAAEEAFTFYDHPKVLIFKKNANYSTEKVLSIFNTVDLTKAVHLLPRQFNDYSNLMLPADRLAQQRAGGTWSQLFNYDWIQNHYPWLGLVIWYLFIFLLGLAVYPIIRLAMPGLADKGYPLSRATGIAVLRLFRMAGWLSRYSLHTDHDCNCLAGDPA